MKRASLTAAFGLLLALPVAAASAGAPGGAPAANPTATPVKLHYKAYAGGLPIIHADIALDLAETDYAIRVDAYTVGLIGALLDWHMVNRSRGVLDEGGRPIPIENVVHGNLNEDDEHTRMIYDGAGGFIAKEVVPAPADQGIESVPDDMTRDTADMLTAFVAAMSSIREGAGCGAPVPVFDGRRRFDLVYRDEGVEQLTASRWNMYEGPARRCVADVRLVKGRWKKRQQWLEDASQRGGDPDRGLITVWFAPVAADSPPVPVRMEIDSPLGLGLVHLRDVTVDPTLAPFASP